MGAPSPGKGLDRTIAGSVDRSFEIAVFDPVNGTVRDVLKDEELSALLKAAIRKQIEDRIKSFLGRNGKGR